MFVLISLWFLFLFLRGSLFLFLSRSPYFPFSCIIFLPLSFSLYPLIYKAWSIPFSLYHSFSLFPLLFFFFFHSLSLFQKSCSSFHFLLFGKRTNSKHFFMPLHDFGRSRSCPFRRRWLSQNLFRTDRSCSECSLTCSL